MTASIELPIWLFVLVLAFAAVTFASHFLFPSVRWFLRRRAERVIARLNRRLTRPIEPFKLLKRQDTIQRLIYDPQVVEAVIEHAKENGLREDVAFEIAHRYAREIVPSFSASTYFGFAVRVARRLTRAFYRVEAHEMPPALQEALANEGAVVFVINHRSNMDYVLAIDIASERSALSFAAGEWARMWPLGALVRGAGAYFVRRKSRNPLYRRVMARYVQMAVRGGVTQAIFPEGGLSLTGRVGPPKLGLLNYIVEDFDMESGQDVLFVPVAVNYDRVLEDRVLLRASQVGGKRKFRLRGRSVARYLVRHAWQRLTGRFLKFGYAALTYGEPLSLREFAQTSNRDLTMSLGVEVMDRIRKVVPITPIPVASTLLRDDRQYSEQEFVQVLSEKLTALTVSHPELIQLHEAPEAEAMIVLTHLKMRKMIQVRGSIIELAAGNAELFDYYAASVQHHLDVPNQKQS